MNNAVPDMLVHKSRLRSSQRKQWSVVKATVNANNGASLRQPNGTLVFSGWKLSELGSKTIQIPLAFALVCPRVVEGVCPFAIILFGSIATSKAQ